MRPANCDAIWPRGGPYEGLVYRAAIELRASDRLGACVGPVDVFTRYGDALYVARADDESGICLAAV